jgi:hypothetical protein
MSSGAGVIKMIPSHCQIGGQRPRRTTTPPATGLTLVER